MDIQGVLIVCVITYFLGNFAGYFVHRLLHTEYMGKAYIDHYHHHVSIYPPEDYLSNEYREPPLGAEQGKYYIFTFLVLCLPFLLWHWAYFILSVSLAIGILKLNAVVHDSLHIAGHKWEKYKWFWWLRVVHYQHHIDVRTNFGIFSFLPDKIFRTYAGTGNYKEKND